MNTKLLMTANALILGTIGVALSFLPVEIARFITLQSDPIVLQLLGAGYLGFAMLNWMNKEKVLGGIYGRPIVMANFAQFMIGGLALFKLVMKESSTTALLILTGVYILLLVLSSPTWRSHILKSREIFSSLIELGLFHRSNDFLQNRLLLHSK